MSVLVVTCPCALSLATPTALTAATGGLTRLGLLVTRGHALESLARATHFVFDKTGTLTEGKLKLLETKSLGELNQDKLLANAAALESRSEHPIARSICAAVSDSKIPVVSDVHSSPGGGVQGKVHGELWYIGSTAFVEQKTNSTIDADIVKSLQSGGRTVVWLADGHSVQAAFILGDELRQGADELVNHLGSLNTQVLLLTGDHEQAASRVADQLDISEFAAEQTPDSKLAHVQKLQQGGAVVAMVGDGVNDAPVLAGAHLSIAMGSSAHIAAASADMLLLSQKLPHLVTAIQVARKTMRIVRQNLAWAVMYNLVALPLAAMGYIAPWMAAIGMSASSLLVVTNALRLTRKGTYSGPK